VVVVHLFGRPAKIERIVELTDSHNVPLIEDAAQVLGTQFNSKKLGSFGDAAAFSFSWNKTVTTGKGGAVATSNEHIAESVNALASQGEKKEKFEMEQGFNYKIDSVRAAVGVSQMKRFEEIVEKKRKIICSYRNKLSDIGEVEVMKEVEGAEVAPWMFFITSGCRKDIEEALEREDIGFRRFYQPINTLGAFESAESFPVTKRLREKGLLLPTYPDMSEKEVEKISSLIRKAVE
jgi:dTDP-4-amino-4,6-dideoxygalactose transaminase